MRYRCLLFAFCCWQTLTAQVVLDWVTITDEQGAFRIDLPERVPPIHHSATHQTHYGAVPQEVYVYQWTDEQERILLMVSHTNALPDVLADSVGLLMDEVLANYAESEWRMDKRWDSSEPLMLAESVIATNRNDAVQFFLRVGMQNARVYRMIAVFEPDRVATARKFIKSFRPLPLRYGIANTVRPTGMNMVVDLPGGPVRYDSSEAQSAAGYLRELYAQDSLSSTNYYASEHYLGPFAAVLPDSVYHQDYFDITRRDFLEVRDTIFRGEPAVYQRLPPGNRSDLWLHRLWFARGMHLYSLSCIYNDDGKGAVAAADYFDSFSTVYAPRKRTPEAATAALFEGLASSDSTQQLAAAQMLDGFDMDQRILPLLYATLEKPLPTTHYTAPPTVADLLWWELGHTYDERTYGFLTERYAAADGATKGRILRALSTRGDHLPSAQFVTRRLGPWLAAQPEHPSVFRFVDFLYNDSLVLDLLPDLDTWMNDPKLRVPMLDMLIKGVFQDAAVADSLALRYREPLQALVESPPTYTHLEGKAALQPHRNAYGILAEMPADSTTIRLLGKGVSHSDPFILQHSVYGLVKAGVPVSDEHWERLKTLPARHYTVANNLAVEERLQQVPEAHRRLPLLAKGAVAKYMEGESDYELRFESLPMIETTVGEEECQVFPVHVRTTEADSDTYLAVAARILPAVDYKLEYYVRFSDVPLTEDNERYIFEDLLIRLTEAE